MELINIFLCFIILNFLANYAIASNSPAGFSTSLINRNSPLSAHYNSSNTYFDNLRESIQRARARSSHLFAPKLSSFDSPSVQTPLTALPGEYLMKVSIGTPPVDLELVADTGSDIIWTQCKPCTSCYSQTDALFDPQNSSTYNKQSCDSTLCQSLGQERTCTDDGSSCQFKAQYGDQSYSNGDFSIESLTFQSTSSGSPVVLPNISFGCGYDNGGNFNTYTDGIVGLGGGEVSFVSQLSEKYFSYCLVPLNANVTSTISFGTTAVVSGPGVQTTPFYTDSQINTFYLLNLQSVSVKGENIKFNAKKFSDKAAGLDQGNIVIDSGTTLTLLDPETLGEILNAFKKSVSANPIEGPSGAQLCYDKSDLSIDEVPTITFHFEGADIDLDALNTLTEFEEGVVCLSFIPADDGPTIFGNLQQMNFLTGYDLEKKTVSFKKVDCSKQ